jgi:2-polyprenyl-3-methyl-5-hydroxy-6-metoxy-1,4-benzoquinol methylase
MTVQIDQKYNGVEHDFDVIRKVIDLREPESLLDFGCGSGRLIPIYLEKNIHNIYCYDVSDKALSLSKSRYTYGSIYYLKEYREISDCGIVFDLTISNRVLQHIPPNEISVTLKQLCEVSRCIYINETLKSAHNYFVFVHDYLRLFEGYGFEELGSGVIYDDMGNDQKWSLFMRRTFHTT